MKNPERCRHKKIALEKINILEISKPFNSVTKEELEESAHNSEYKEQKVVLCLECGRELEIS